ncbi:hypothetical protein ACFYWO_23015 [Streptomyces sp. NPDC002932]|uniref:hypothetical protein n=1 Tax=Streptomyces sp. NPDC002932 TaxID=3364672 RepID=UPI0036B930F0
MDLERCGLPGLPGPPEEGEGGYDGHLGYATPLLESWGPSVTSLREITTAHVQEALDNASGVDGVFTALRSLFKALKRERVVFHDPARSATFMFRAAVRRPVPSDRLVGLIDRSWRTFASPEFKPDPPGDCRS